MDMTTKTLLAAIAAGLWANAAATFNIPAKAQTPIPPLPQRSPPPTNPQTLRPNLVPHDADLNDIARYILDLNSPLLNIQLSLSHLEEGYCRNRKLCGP